MKRLFFYILLVALLMVPATAFANDDVSVYSFPPGQFGSSVTK